MGCLFSAAIRKGRCYRRLGTHCPTLHPGQCGSSAGTTAPPTLGISLWTKSSSEAHSPRSPPPQLCVRQDLASAQQRLSATFKVKPLGDKACRGAHPTVPTVGTGPGCARSLPATDVSFLCIKWGCSWCSWPAMQKGHGFSFGFIFMKTAPPVPAPCRALSHPTGMLQTPTPSPAPMPCPGAPVGCCMMKETPSQAKRRLLPPASHWWHLETHLSAFQTWAAPWWLPRPETTAKAYVFFLKMYKSRGLKASVERMLRPSPRLVLFGPDSPANFRWRVLKTSEPPQHLPQHHVRPRGLVGFMILGFAPFK